MICQKLFPHISTTQCESAIAKPLFKMKQPVIQRLEVQMIVMMIMMLMIMISSKPDHCLFTDGVETDNVDAKLHFCRSICN